MKKKLVFFSLMCIIFLQLSAMHMTETLQRTATKIAEQMRQETEQRILSRVGDKNRFADICILNELQQLQTNGFESCFSDHDAVTVARRVQLHPDNPELSGMYDPENAKIRIAFFDRLIEPILFSPNKNLENFKAEMKKYTRVAILVGALIVTLNEKQPIQ